MKTADLQSLRKVLCRSFSTELPKSSLWKPEKLLTGSLKVSLWECQKLHLENSRMLSSEASLEATSRKLESLLLEIQKVSPQSFSQEVWKASLWKIEKLLSGSLKSFSFEAWRPSVLKLENLFTGSLKTFFLEAWKASVRKPVPELFPIPESIFKSLLIGSRMQLALFLHIVHALPHHLRLDRARRVDRAPSKVENLPSRTPAWLATWSEPRPNRSACAQRDVRSIS